MINKFMVTIFVVLLILPNIIISYGDFNEILKEHWSKDIVDREFIERYFPNLAREDFTYFKPDEGMSVESFKESLDSLISFYNGNKQKPILRKTLEEKEPKKSEDSNTILRRDAIKMVADLLDDKVEAQQITIPPNDIENLDKDYMDAIVKAYNHGIIKGDPDSGFRLDDPLTQIEAVIILERFKGVIDRNIRGIPFKVISESSSANGEERVEVVKRGDKVSVTISRSFSHPGFDMDIEEIKRIVKGKYKVYMKTKVPDPDRIYPQVITYITIVLEIDRNLLEEKCEFEPIISGIPQINQNKL